MTDHWLPLAASAVLKSTTLLAAGIAVSRLMARTSAAARHFALGIVMIAAGLLVPLSVLLPPVDVPLLPSLYSPTAAVAITSSLSAGRDVRSPAILSRSSRDSGGNFSLPAEFNMPMQSAAPSNSRIDRASYPQSGAMLAVVWLVGAMLVASFHLIGVAVALRIRQRASPVDDHSLLAMRDSLASSLGIRRPVALYVAPGMAMPATWGLVRASILLPQDFRSWANDRLRAVLHHELAHIARRDCVWQVVCTVACALHWYNPLAWIAARSLRAQRERACDDLVLSHGSDACDYADHLVGIAQRYRTSGPAAFAVIGMARSSQLEGRLHSILDAATVRNVPTRGTRLLGAMVLVLLPLAAMRPWRPAPVDQTTANAAREPLASPVLRELTPLPPVTDTLSWTRHMTYGQSLRVYTMKSAVLVERSQDDNVHILTIFGTDDGRGPRQHELDEDERSIEVCPALPAGVKRIPVSGCWPVDWEGEVKKDNAVLTVVRVPKGLNLDIKTSSGDIVAKDAEVPIVAGSVDGSIRIHTGSYATANTVTGDVDVIMDRADWRGSISLKTVSGRIALSLPDAANTDVELMNSTGKAQTGFALERVWRGDRWRFHGAARLGNGGRRVTAESWTGAIVVRRAGDTTVIPMRLTYSGTQRRDSRDKADNAQDDGGRYATYLEKPYAGRDGGVTGERINLQLPSNFLRQFSRARLAGAADSAALTRLAERGTAQWLAYQMGRDNPGVELGGERSLWALSLSDGRRVVGPVAAKLTSPDWRERAYAAWVLGDLRAMGTGSLLLSGLRDEHWRVRMTAAYALGQTRPNGAMQQLVVALSDPHYQVRTGVLDALQALGDKRALPAVRTMLDDPHAMVRGEAAVVVDALSAVR